MRVLSLFSGIGLGDLGLQMAGMEIVGQIEIDDYCQKILTLRWPNVPKWKDIKNVRPEELPTADLISGGFPCQPFSVAGKRRGKEDGRYLRPEMFKIIEAKRPTWVLGENVPGIIKMGLDEVLSGLEGLGYACQTFNIPACATDADHRRARIWIVAHTSKLGWYERTDIPREKRQEIRGREFTISSKMVADTNRNRTVWDKSEYRERGGIKSCGGNAPDSIQPGLEGQPGNGAGRSEPGWISQEQNGSIGEEDLQYRKRWREFESGIRRVAHGVPNRVDRLKGLGNGQHIHTVYEIGRLIMEYEKHKTTKTGGNSMFQYHKEATTISDLVKFIDLDLNTMKADMYKPVPISVSEPEPPAKVTKTKAKAPEIVESQPSQPTQEITFEQMKEALQKVANTGFLSDANGDSLKRATKILNDLEYRKIKEVKPEDYKKILDACQLALQIPARPGGGIF